MLSFTNHTNSDPEFSFKGEVIKPAHACRYLGEQIDSKLTFENHLNSVLTKLAHAIRSLYLVIYLSVEYPFKLLQQKNINRIKRQINWEINVCYFLKKFQHSINLLIKDRILPAEYFI